MRPFRGSDSVLPSYIFLAILLTWPVIRVLTIAIPSVNATFDPGLQAYLLGWDWSSLRHGITGIFDPPIFYPERNVLTYMDHMIGETVAASPVLWLSGSVAAGYNFLFLISFALSGWAVYRLARLANVSRLGSYLAGLLFAFCAYRQANTDLLNQLQTEFLPLGMLFAIRYIQKQKLRHLVGVVSVLVVQVYFGWYYTFYLAVALALLLVHALIRRLITIKLIYRVLALALIGSLTTLPVVLPYLHEHSALPEFHRSLGESALYSADVLDYFKVSSRSIAAGWANWPSGHNSYFPGFVGVCLAIVATWRPRNRHRTQPESYFAILAFTAFVLSLGPILQVAGVRTWVPLPYSVLYFVVPGFSGMRAPGRFAVLVALGVSVLAGVGFDRARRELKNDRARLAFEAMAFGITLLFAIAEPLRSVQLPTDGNEAPVYTWLSTQHDSAAPILELPLPTRDSDENETDALRQYASLLHGHPRLDGTSGFVSKRYQQFRAVLQDFPDPKTIEAAEEMGTDLIIVHLADYSPRERSELLGRIPASPRLHLLARINQDLCLELRKP